MNAEPQNTSRPADEAWRVYYTHATPAPDPCPFCSYHEEDRA